MSSAIAGESPTTRLAFNTTRTGIVWKPTGHVVHKREITVFREILPTRIGNGSLLDPVYESLSKFSFSFYIRKRNVTIPEMRTIKTEMDDLVLSSSRAVLPNHQSFSDLAFVADIINKCLSLSRKYKFTGYSVTKTEGNQVYTLDLPKKREEVKSTTPVISIKKRKPDFTVADVDSIKQLKTMGSHPKQNLKRKLHEI